MTQPTRFRKKPVEIEAIQFTGTGDSCTAVTAFFGHPYAGTHRWKSTTYDGGWIITLEGEMEFKPGDWIIRGIKGEYYPCKPDIFDATYEPVEAEPTEPTFADQMRPVLPEHASIRHSGGIAAHAWTARWTTTTGLWGITWTWMLFGGTSVVITGPDLRIKQQPANAERVTALLRVLGAIQGTDQ